MADSWFTGSSIRKLLHCSIGQLYNDFIAAKGHKLTKMTKVSRVLNVGQCHIAYGAIDAVSDEVLCCMSVIKGEVQISRKYL
jgi:hypothetical protein